VAIVLSITTERPVQGKITKFSVKIQHYESDPFALCWNVARLMFETRRIELQKAAFESGGSPVSSALTGRSEAGSGSGARGECIDFAGQAALGKAQERRRVALGAACASADPFPSLT
jgi:hypothetical protein